MKALSLLLATLLGLFVAGGAYVWGELAAFLETAPDPAAGEKLVVVPADASPTDIAGLLVKEGLADADPWLQIYAEHLHPAAKVKGGEYALSRSMTPVQQFERVESGRVVTHTFTIPGGATLTEIAQRLKALGLGEEQEILALARSPSFLSEQQLVAESLEGFLVADAYNLPRGLSAQVLCARLLERFRELVPSAALEQVRLRGLSTTEVVTLASLIEKSNVPPDERRLFAAMLYNRLSAKIPLEIPAADAYGADREPPVVVKGKVKPHRWSTATRPGLPATPICAPSPEALAAALQPAPSRALYWVEREDRTHVFCEDLDCYVAESERWKRPLSPVLQKRLSPPPL